eukprot:gene8010-biopygen13630
MTKWRRRRRRQEENEEKLQRRRCCRKVLPNNAPYSAEHRAEMTCCKVLHNDAPYSAEHWAEMTVLQSVAKSSKDQYCVFNPEAQLNPALFNPVLFKSARVNPANFTFGVEIVRSLESAGFQCSMPGAGKANTPHSAVLHSTRFAALVLTRRGPIQQRDRAPSGCPPVFFSSNCSARARCGPHAQNIGAARVTCLGG